MREREERGRQEAGGVGRRTKEGGGQNTRKGREEGGLGEREKVENKELEGGERGGAGTGRLWKKS